MKYEIIIIRNRICEGCNEKLEWKQIENCPLVVGKNREIPRYFRDSNHDKITRVTIEISFFSE